MKKGLCSICIKDEGCTFPRQFPVLQCEEYVSAGPAPAKKNKVEQKKMKFDESDQELEMRG